MPGTFHPAGHALFGDVFERVPGVRLLIASCANAAIEVSLIEVLSQPFREITSKVLPACVTGTFSSLGGIPAVRVDVIEEVPASHVRAVRAGHVRQFGVELQGTELLAPPFVIDQFMNAAFQRGDLDLRLSRFLGRGRGEGSAQGSDNGESHEKPHVWIVSARRRGEKRVDTKFSRL